MVALEDIDPLGVPDVARACTRFKATTAVGVDRWSPRTFLPAPIDSLEVFTGILRTVEETLLPSAMLCLSHGHAP
eukprot:4418598-Pyramimonas_sp.AAC.1